MSFKELQPHGYGRERIGEEEKVCGGWRAGGEEKGRERKSSN